MNGIFNLIYDIIVFFVDNIANFFSRVFNEVEGSTSFLSKEINLYLFSDNLIFSADIFELITFISTIIFLVIIIRFLIKATYNFVKRVFGVFKL